MKSSFVRIAVGALCLSAASFASAHPKLVASTPKEAESLGTSPTALRLKFNEPLEVKFTTVRLTGPGGTEVAPGAVQAVEGDANAVVLTLPSLTPGEYKAHWSAIGRDGHRVKGDLGFTVR